MELTTSNRRMTPVSASNPLARDIVGRYGPAQEFISRFSPDKAGYCARHLPQAVSAGCPSLALVSAAYGDETVVALLLTHVSAVILRMGEESTLTAGDARFIAEGIAGNGNARLLSVAGVLAFFHRMACGEMRMYGTPTPRKFLECFGRYAEETLNTERRLRLEADNERQRQQRQRHSETAMTFEEYKRLRNLGEDIKSPLDIINKT